MSAYHDFTASRGASPDPVALIAGIRTACGDQGAGASLTAYPTIRVKKLLDWQLAEVAATQAAIDAAPDLTPQRVAQNEVDQFPMALRALVLTLIDQINVLRGGLPTPLSPISAQQALTAIRNKAATL